MPTPASGTPPRALRWAVAGSVIVMIAAGGLFYYASQLAAAKRKVHGNEVTVTIHPHSCEPNALTVPAGFNSFRIVNASERAVEWEILDGVLVVEERENIAPGLSQVINATLTPGDYAITCGLLSNPRGTLHVTPTAASEASARARPALVAFIGPLSEFRVYLSSQGNALTKAVDALSQAIAAGDLAQAQALYVPAREAYQRLAPAAQRLAELDNSINARADYFEKREQDPGFIGFHRLEYGLFEQRSTQGLTSIAQQLLANSDGIRPSLSVDQTLPSRRKNEAPAPAPAPAPALAPAPAPVVETVAPVVAAVSLAKPAADVLDEAERLIGQRQLSQAQALLKAAIEQEPQRSDLRLKLMQVYGEQGAREDFVAQERQLVANGKNHAQVEQLKQRYPGMVAAAGWIFSQTSASSSKGCPIGKTRMTRSARLSSRPVANNSSSRHRSGSATTTTHVDAGATCS